MQCVNCDKKIEEDCDQSIQCEVCRIYACSSCKEWVFNKYCSSSSSEEEADEEGGVDIYGSPICDSCAKTNVN